MSSFTLMNIGASALSANSAELNTIGNNISNANTAGYARETVNLVAVPGTSSGSGFFGDGVSAQSVVRSYNAYLSTEANLTAAQSSADSTLSNQLSQLESLFPTGSSNVGAMAQTVLNDFTSVANEPQDASARQTVLSDAQQFASTMNQAASQISTMQSGVNSTLTTSVQSVNQITAQIATLNQQIFNMQGSGGQPNELLDQRDQLVTQLSQYVQVTTVPQSDGTLSVFLGGSQTLVLGNQASSLAVTQDQYDPTKSALSISNVDGTRTLDTSTIAGGSIPALIQFQNNNLTQASNSLGQLATSFASAVNQQQSLGLNLNATPSAGQPIFSTASPVVLPSTNNTRDASGNYASTVSLSITNASQLQASNYTLQADPNNAGNYLVTRLSDGQQTSVPNGGTVDGFTINVGTPPPAATDTYLLEPVGQGAAGIQVVMTNPNGIAAASPLTVTAGTSNTGTTEPALTMVSGATDPTQAASVTFTSGTAYNWSLTTAAGTTTGTGTWTPGQAITLNDFSLQLNGVPASGDSFQVAPTTYPAANNGNALALSALQNQNLVGLQLDSSGTATGGLTFTGAYTSAMTSVGTATAAASSAATMSQTLASTAQTNLSNQTGVNLDEEAASLLQYQQSYQAAAKVIQVAQAIFDSLLSTVDAAT